MVSVAPREHQGPRVDDESNQRADTHLRDLSHDDLPVSVAAAEFLEALPARHEHHGAGKQRRVGGDRQTDDGPADGRARGELIAGVEEGRRGERQVVETGQIPAT